MGFRRYYEVVVLEIGEEEESLKICFFFEILLLILSIDSGLRLTGKLKEAAQVSSQELTDYARVSS
jgi:hypothetical protein